MNALAEILSSKTRAEILRLLFGLDSRPLHLRELERLSHLSTGSLRQELTKLHVLGLVSMRRDGNRVLYQAEMTHSLYPELHSLVLKTAGLVDVVKESLQDSTVDCALIFGSIARGEASADSDIDILLIGDLGLRDASRLLSGLGNVLGREINPLVMTAAEFEKRRQTKEHLVSNILSSPKLFVIGTENELESMG